MAKSADNTNTFVLEYQGGHKSTEAAFNHLISAISDGSPEITGFRLELKTADSFDGPFDMLVSKEATQGIVPATVDSGNDGEPATTGSRDSDTIPTLQSDALPSQVLARMLDHDGDEIRSSDLQDEFDDEEIDTARISQTLASLKRRGLVAAKPDPADKRANIYWPTEKGQKALKNHSQ